MVLWVVSLQRFSRRVRLCSARGQYITGKSATGFAWALHHVTSIEMVVSTGRSVSSFA